MAIEEMNRTGAVHGKSDINTDGLQKKIASRGSSMRQGIADMYAVDASERMQGRQHAHEKDLLIHQQNHELTLQAAKHEQDMYAATHAHVLAKDMHKTLMSGAADGSQIDMTHGNIKTSITRKDRTKKTAAPEQKTGTQVFTVGPAGNASEPAAEPAPTETAPQGHTSFLGSEIPTKPEEWKGGTVQRNPVTGKTESNPAYRDWKTRKQHFDEASGKIAKLQEGNHFEPKSGVKISNYAKKAMAKKAAALRPQG